jgi:hypothetical protein
MTCHACCILGCAQWALLFAISTIAIMQLRAYLQLLCLAILLAEGLVITFGLHA